MAVRKPGRLFSVMIDSTVGGRTLPLAFLFTRSGPFEGRRWQINGPFGIGRHPHNRLELVDTEVSRFHAIIEFTDAGFRILDLGSGNGTWVNGHRVNEIVLQEGDEIRIGQTRMEFSLMERSEQRNEPDAKPYGRIQMIDLHCHILPGLDDGPQSMEESLEMCRIASRDGIRTMVAVAHTLSGVYLNDAKTILGALEKLSDELQKTNLDLEILPGAEVHVNPSVPQMIREGGVMTINQLGKAVMIEFPKFFVPDVMCRFLESLLEEGIIPVISHPERTPKFGDQGLLREMVQMGALTQVTALSLTGGFGAGPQYLTRSFLEEGLVHVIASDGHSVKQRPPVLSRAVAEAGKICGTQRAMSLVTDNPFSLLRGEHPTITERHVDDRALTVADRPCTAAISAQGVRLRAAKGNTKDAQDARPRAQPDAVPLSSVKTLIISVISNKGGVGKTHFSINLAYALAQAGTNVLLIDADLGNADISNKLDIFPEQHLLDFLMKNKKMDELILKTDFAFDLICGTSGEFKLANLNSGQKMRFVKHFKNTAKSYQLAIFDLSSGITRTTMDFALAADRTVIVTTPQDLYSGYTGLRACFFRFKDIERKLEVRLPNYRPQRTFSPMLVLNQVNDFEQGFEIYHGVNQLITESINAKEGQFKLDLEYLGGIPYDRESLLAAESRRRPLLLEFPHTKASQCIKHMSTRFCYPERPYDPTVKFIHPFRRFVSILSQKT